MTRTRRMTAALGAAVMSVMAVGATPASATPTDTTPPVVDSVTSSDYPADDSGQSSMLHQGEPGSFTFTMHDDGGGVRRVDWSLQSELPVDRPAQTAHSGYRTLGGVPSATVTVSVTPADWGTNVLYVRALDRAGSYSQSLRYTFYVPYAAPTTVQGDLTGDGIRDLVLVDGAGNLTVAPGTASGTFGTSYVAAAADESPFDTGFAGAVLAHRGSSTGSGPDDLWVQLGGSMSLFTNRGGYFARGGGDPTAVDRGPCDCDGYPDDWSTLTSMVAVGSATGGYHGGQLVTIEDGRAYAYSRFGRALADPQPLALQGVDLPNSDLIAPGDATGDGVEDLWVRNRRTGSVTQFAGVGTPGDSEIGTTGSVLVAKGFPAARYPAVTSVGDVDGDGVADLLTLTTGGALQRRSAADPTTAVRVSTSALGRNARTMEDQQVPAPGL